MASPARRLGVSALAFAGAAVLLLLPFAGMPWFVLLSSHTIVEGVPVLWYPNEWAAFGALTLLVVLLATAGAARLAAWGTARTTRALIGR